MEGIIRPLKSVVGRQRQQRDLPPARDRVCINSDMTVYGEFASSDRQAERVRDQRENHANRAASQPSGGNLSDVRFFRDEKPSPSPSDFRKTAHSGLDKQKDGLQSKVRMKEDGQSSMRGQPQA